MSGLFSWEIKFNTGKSSGSRVRVTVAGTWLVRQGDRCPRRNAIAVVRGEGRKKIRLYGLDCPEKKQLFGTRAAQFNSGMAYAKTVEVESVARDRWGRIVAVVRN